ncbi:UDP-glucose 4-epimerase family protein [Pseudomonas sp. K2I15]|uniref:UDP-glucose 4-epimerase family protein n=1 Tax=unclassified Pseudomonas TaxID=196821 RepID=UPI000B4D52D6|nr:SDR family oxidoreductase [Pseudomonas sp. K2I15]OWP69558.1 NAD-dependent dehydratase [Pseudomonas sp. K2I15]
MKSSSVLVTGGSGFLGRALIAHLASIEHLSVAAALRNLVVDLPSSVRLQPVGTLDGATDWSLILSDVDIVVHTAARVHVMADVATDPLAEFRAVNVEGTLNLGRQAAIAGVKRFIFISSIKVNGEQTNPGHVFTADDLPAPVDPYGISKYEAEQGLLKIAAESSMEVVIIRPVLVYGAGVKANFLNMMRWLDKGVPLPFGSISNSRSLVSLDNLIDLIVVCFEHPNAANQVFLVSDDDDISTSTLLQKMGLALGKPARLLPVPCWFLRAALVLSGKAPLAQRLLGSLKVDIRKNAELLNWVPSVKMESALRTTAQYFLEHKKA